MYIVMDIGCLECQNPTEMVGAFESLLDAKQAAQAHSDAGWDRSNARTGLSHVGPKLKWLDVADPDKYHWSGDGVYAVFDSATRSLVSGT